MEKFLRNFLAIGLGSYIGSEVALRLSGRFCWAGLIVGGIFGYLSVDFREIVAAVSTARKTVFSISLTQLQKAFWYAVFMLILNLGIFALIGFVASQWLFLEKRSINIAFDWFMLYSVATIFAGIFKGLFTAIETRDSGQIPDDDKKALDLVICHSIARFAGPVKAFTYWPKEAAIALAKGAWWTILQTPEGARRTVLFLKIVFATIHNDKRLVRLYYCAIGSAIGYACGRPLMGFLIGGIVGAVCAWIIPMFLVPKSANASP